jgi:hypothetical protein
MTPQPRDLDPQTQLDLAYAAASTMTEHEIYDFVFWQTQMMPEMFLVELEQFRRKGHTGDGWDQAD